MKEQEFRKLVRYIIKEALQDRPKPFNIRNEPPYPGIPTVRMTAWDANATTHEPTKRCGINGPHDTSNCGEWSKQDTRPESPNERPASLQGGHLPPDTDAPGWEQSANDLSDYPFREKETLVSAANRGPLWVEKMNEAQFRTLVRFIIKEIRDVMDEDSNTFSAGGAVDIPAAFSNNADTKKKKKLPEKAKKFIPDTTFEPYEKPKKKLTDVHDKK